jgi:hypothetical protein
MAIAYALNTWDSGPSGGWAQLSRRQAAKKLCISRRLLKHRIGNVEKIENSTKVNKGFNS